MHVPDPTPAKGLGWYVTPCCCCVLYVQAMLGVAGILFTAVSRGRTAS